MFVNWGNFEIFQAFDCFLKGLSEISSVFTEFSSTMTTWVLVESLYINKKSAMIWVFASWGWEWSDFANRGKPFVLIAWLRKKSSSLVLNMRIESMNCLFNFQLNGYCKSHAILRIDRIYEAELGLFFWVQRENGEEGGLKMRMECELNWTLYGWGACERIWRSKKWSFYILKKCLLEESQSSN